MHCSKQFPAPQFDTHVSVCAVLSTVIYCKCCLKDDTNVFLLHPKGQGNKLPSQNNFNENRLPFRNDVTAMYST